MTAPGGASGEDAAEPHPAGGQHPQQPGWAGPWDYPASPPPADHPPPPYSPGVPLDYPPGTPPFGYQQPGHGGPAYPPGPPQFGGPPPGYGAAPYPGGYYPAPGYQGDYWSAEVAAPGTNGMAIASLIASFTGLFCCIGGIAAIVLGIIAIDQIKRTRQDGYGTAVAGIVIGVATLIVGLIVMIFAVHSH
ncbi:DUF4190 domain-containing protein [Mycobacterium montefiorense]|uniref:DUF4190 domain-containing protein n=1 Tax=Mycobacterium montefiorense TaxID=154654 RepID=A0AA37PLU3_9MYCO|nr:DUF4190 domain-containing protein [Mycobacterium montefiorense]GBG37561.1 hypothetical protein MmonteBS_19330 [Mycobacterium montefiorense]GKU36130.1 hypothetical protein NJB14191_34760 [Mycobacterium montefiorense]GKU41652.1 hypothetical protein NJB14192_36360 [Mycobacterium montefiorense]GKU47348.1 hypothetical protein NJB14194_39660 [Mycobacterium montefiorense]GKU48795.1 hypothetical protein NJB14195_00440 [Mycobacterium montefiorense]